MNLTKSYPHWTKDALDVPADHGGEDGKFPLGSSLYMSQLIYDMPGHLDRSMEYSIRFHFPADMDDVRFREHYTIEVDWVNPVTGRDEVTEEYIECTDIAIAHDENGVKVLCLEYTGELEF